MRRKANSIQKNMFYAFAAGLAVVITIIITVYIMQTYALMKDEVTSSMMQLSGNIGERLDDELQRNSLLSENIVFSRDVRRIFFTELPESLDAVTTYRLSNQFNQLMYSITGPKLPFYQMNILDLSGHRVTFGQEYNYTELTRQQMDSIPWLEKAVERDGKLHIVATHESELNSYPAQVISLCRGFAQLIGGKVSGVVEIQVSFDTIDTIVKSTAYIGDKDNEKKMVLVLDKEGNLVYPERLEDGMLEYYGSAVNKLEENGIKNMRSKNPVTKDNEFIFEAVSGFSEWRVMLIMPESILMEPIRRLILQILFLGLLLLMGSAVFSMYMSRIYTIPINKLYHSVQSLTLENLGTGHQVQINSGVNELEQLNDVFNMMTIRLQESLEETVAAKNMEIHSRMLALQAQMNPHFLYNTLTVISIMADNEEKENVRWACRNLSDMLSYISSESLKPVRLEEEWRHTCNYIDIIKMRYMDDIVFESVMPEAMFSLQIPKLVIQPLVENAVKYATNKMPVWNISVEAWEEEGKWFVSVKDNGTGFPEETLRELKEKIRNIEVLGNIPQLALDGMGLLNIYLRMRFFYKNDLTFHIENLPEEGAEVIIGGLLRPGTENGAGGKV